MYNTDLYKRIRSEVDKIKIIDTHEHLNLPHELEGAGPFDFGRLFGHYSNSDFISAGMSPEVMEKVQMGNSGWSIKEKWQAMKPYYQKSWNTAYCEVIRVAIQDLYGIEDLTDDTVEKLSRKVNDAPRDTWTRTVFDRAGIDIALQQWLAAEPVYARKRYPDLFLYDMYDVFSFLDIGNPSKEAGINTHCLSDYLRVIDYYFDRYACEASAFKISQAYLRPLFFDDVTFSDAERVFSRVLQYNNRPGRKEIQALEDYIVHYCLGKAEEYDLPVKFHTGLQAGNGNDIKNSRAALMANLFMKYPGVKFDIYHISWPYTEELIAICKNFPNVFIDFAWAWAFNPPACRRYLSDMLETVPANKIHGFGGDYMFVEGSYGHSVIARREISRVLAEKVEEGRFSEDHALYVAQRILRENALENFRVEEKRKVYGERAEEG